MVYKASNDATGKTLAWLEQHDFSARTGIAFSRIHRIIENGENRDKTPFMNQSSDTHHGTTVVVDDRLQVMGNFIGKVPSLFLFRAQLDEVLKFRHEGALAKTIRVMDWKTICAKLGV